MIDDIDRCQIIKAAVQDLPPNISQDTLVAVSLKHRQTLNHIDNLSKKGKNSSPVVQSSIPVQYSSPVNSDSLDILFAGIKKSLYMASSLVVEGSSSLEISTRLTKM